MTDGQKFFPWTDSQPNSVQFIPADQMDQSGISTSAYMVLSLLFRDQAPEPGIDTQDRFSQEETPVLNWIVFTMAAVPADTEVHDPMVAGLIDERFHHLRRQDQGTGVLDRLVDLDGVIFGKIEHFIPFEKHAIDSVPHHRQPGRPSAQETSWEGFLEKSDEPDGS